MDIEELLQIKKGAGEGLIAILGYSSTNQASLFALAGE